MDALHIEKVNQSFTAFRQAAGLDDHDHLLQLMNALADSGQVGEGGEYENLFALLANLLEAQDRRAQPVPDATPGTHRAGFAQECQRQCLLAEQADKADAALQTFMSAAQSDVAGWTG